MDTRNDPLVFAKRTLKNLEFIERANSPPGTVHVITQIFNSLLGLIVMPRERGREIPGWTRVQNLTVAELSSNGWPEWIIKKSSPRTTTITLGDLTKRLRNAAAHGLVEFSSDAAEPTAVIISVFDRPSEQKPIDWTAEIGAADLRAFCSKFVKSLQASST